MRCCTSLGSVVLLYSAVRGKERRGVRKLKLRIARSEESSFRAPHGRVCTVASMCNAVKFGLVKGVLGILEQGSAVQCSSVKCSTNVKTLNSFLLFN